MEKEEDGLDHIIYRRILSTKYSVSNYRRILLLDFFVDNYQQNIILSVKFIDENFNDKFSIVDNFDLQIDFKHYLQILIVDNINFSWSAQHIGTEMWGRKIFTIHQVGSRQGNSSMYPNIFLSTSDMESRGHLRYLMASCVKQKFMLSISVEVFSIRRIYYYFEEIDFKFLKGRRERLE